MFGINMRAAAVCGAVLCAAPLAVAGAASGATPPSYQEYVALGDSYTASTGFSTAPDTTFVPLGCAQSPSDYPHQVAALLKSQGQLANFKDASCGGATSNDFANPQSTSAGTNAPEFDRITANTDLVTIGIGGNDIGLVGLAEQCIEDGPTYPLTSCQASHVKNGVDDVETAIAAAQVKIEKAVNTVRALASKKVRIIIVNYLEAVPDNGQGCYPLIPVGPGDMAWFTQKYKHMNAMLAAAAADTKADLADTYTPTIGHNACASPLVRYVEPVGVITLNPVGSISAPLHPNQSGANAQSQLVFARIAQG